MLLLRLPKEHRFSVFENRMLKEILGPKTEKVTTGEGKLHNEQLHN
jgi:hypothetical protein